MHEPSSPSWQYLRTHQNSDKVIRSLDIKAPSSALLSPNLVAQTFGQNPSAFKLNLPNCQETALAVESAEDVREVVHRKTPAGWEQACYNPVRV